MSVWTHVAAVIRIDALRLPGGLDQKPDLGTPVSYNDPPDEWEACDIPCGSEGSLKYQLWENPNTSHLAAYTAMIWGDLRDYSDVGEIVAYLTRITENALHVRQGIAEIEVEGQPVHIYSYGEDGWVEVSL